MKEVIKIATTTPNIALHVTPSADTEKRVQTWRNEIADDTADSNMMIIDHEIDSLKKNRAHLVDGKVPSSELPSYVDDVLEFERYSMLPTVGEQGKIYVVYGDTKANNGQYRWTGTVYASISSQIDFATKEEAEAGEENSKAMTALRSKELFAVHSASMLTYTVEEVAEIVKNNADTLNGKTAEQIETAAKNASRPNTWTPTAVDVGAVPTDRRVNGKPLTADVALTAGDVGALPTTGGTLTGDLDAFGQKIKAQQLFLNYYDASYDDEGIAFSLDMPSVMNISARGGEPAEILISRVGGLRSPTYLSDATNKQYVDEKVLVFDVTIRTQAEFNALIASSTWLGAVSVCFIGNGGALRFTRSDGQGCTIPQTVKQIQGLNSATIEVTNFVGNATSNKAALWYTTPPTTNDYWIDGMTVNCTGTYSDSCAFCGCTKLINCTATAFISGYGDSYGFYLCTKLTNCTATVNGEDVDGAYGEAFTLCTNLINCTATVDFGISRNGTAFAFHSCTQLANCAGSANVEGHGTAFAFHSCTQLANCAGISEAINSYAFNSCTQLTNCAGTGFSEGNGFGFYDCDYLNGCKHGASPSTTDFLGGTNIKVDTLTVVAS